MKTKMFGTHLHYRDFVWTKFGEDRLFKSDQSAADKICVQSLCAVEQTQTRHVVVRTTTRCSGSHS